MPQTQLANLGPGAKHLVSISLHPGIRMQTLTCPLPLLLGMLDQL